jgi:hypothetical protein
MLTRRSHHSDSEGQAVKAPEMCRWSLKWSNPYTNPPEGMPRVIAEQILPRGQRPEEIYKQHVLGSGYGIHFQPMPSSPPRQLTLEAKQSIRRKSVARRIEKAAPLFAASLIPQTIAAQPEYFGPAPQAGATARTKEQNL